MALNSEKTSKLLSTVNPNELLCPWFPESFWVQALPNWNELPEDVICLILQKLGTFEILYTAQFVCSLWRKLSKQAHLFRYICFQDELDIFDGDDWKMQIIVSEAVDRSCGQMIEFSIDYDSIVDDDLFCQVVETSKQLKCLRLASSPISGRVIEHLKRVPFLEELQLCCLYSEPWEMQKLAGAIIENIPSLCRLHLAGCYIDDNFLRMILNGCPNLVHLDLGQCYDGDIDPELQMKCAEKFKTFKLAESLFLFDDRSFVSRYCPCSCDSYSYDEECEEEYYDPLDYPCWQAYDNGYGDYYIK